MNTQKIPSIIARPYSLASKESPQRKDFQRFLLENSVSFMATVAVASVIDLFEQIKNSDSPDTNKLSAIREALVIDLDRMALGTWCRVLRETVDKVLSQENAKDLFIPEICSFYATKSKLESTINNLVTIRNQDAHGNPIPEDQLKQELDQRQKMLDQVMEGLAFLEQYQLLVLESFDVSDKGTIYNGKEFIGDGNASIEITTNESLPLNTPILYKNGKFLSLAPLCIYSKIDGQDEKHVAIFSKKLDSEGSSAEYLNIGGHSTVNISEFDDEFGVTYQDKYIELKDIYSDPSNEPVANIDLQASLKVSDKSLNIAEEGTVIFELINTKKSTTLYDLALVLDLPDSFQLDESDFDGEHIKYQKDTNTVFIDYETFLEEQKEKVVFRFTPNVQGSYTIRPGILTAKYWRKETDKEKDEKEGGGLAELNVDVPLASIEVKDPNSKNEISPIINAKKRFTLLEDGNTDFEIGEKFLYELELENIGLSSAYNVQLEILFPKHIELVDGIETVTTSLNPGEIRNFKYIVRTKQPGIYNIIVCDIRYFDVDNNKYITQLNDDFRVLVKSNIEKELRYFIEDAYSDLYLNQEEKTQIELNLSKYDVLTEEMAQQARFDAVVSNVRNLIKTKCANKDIKVSESVYTEDKRNLNARNKTSQFQVETPRKSLVFSINECPFFAINLSEQQNIEFYGFESLARRIYSNFIKDDQYIMAGRTYELRDVLKFNDIEFLPAEGKQKLGRALFSTWVDKAIEALQKTQLRMKNFSDLLGKKYNTRFQLISDSEMVANLGESFTAHSGFNQNKIWLLRNAIQEGDRGLFKVVFSITQEVKANLEEELYQIPGVSNLTDIGKDENVYAFSPYRFYNTDRRGQYIAYEIKSKDDFEDALDQIEEIRILILKAHSKSLLQQEPFKNCYNIEVFNRSFDELFEQGIALRTSDMKKTIEAYSYNSFLPDKVDYFSCLGFISTSGKNFKIFVKFFDPVELSEEEWGIIEINPRFYSQDIVRSLLFMINQKGEESETTLMTALKILKSAASSFTPGVAQIIPKPLFRDYFTAYCRAQSGVPALINAIYDAGGVLEITSKTEFSVDKKEVAKTLRRFKEHPTKHYIESFIKITGSKDLLTVTITPKAKVYIDEIKEENPTLDFCEAGDAAKIREYISYFKQCHPVLAAATTSPSWAARKLPDLIWGYQPQYCIAIGNQTLLPILEVKDTGEDGASILETFKQNLDPESVSEIRFSGRDNQHVKVVGIPFDHDNYNNFSNAEWKQDVFSKLEQTFKEWDEFLTRCN